ILVNSIWLLMVSAIRSSSRIYSSIADRSSSNSLERSRYPFRPMSWFLISWRVMEARIFSFLFDWNRAFSATFRSVISVMTERYDDSPRSLIFTVFTMQWWIAPSRNRRSISPDEVGEFPAKVSRIAVVPDGERSEYKGWPASDSGAIPAIFVAAGLTYR